MSNHVVARGYHLALKRGAYDCSKQSREATVTLSVGLTGNRTCDELLLFEGTEVRNSQEECAVRSRKTLKFHMVKPLDKITGA